MIILGEVIILGELYLNVKIVLPIYRVHLQGSKEKVVNQNPCTIYDLHGTCINRSLPVRYPSIII